MGEPPPGNIRRHCHEETQIINEPRTGQEVLTASNIQVIKNDPIVYDPTTEAGLPDKLFVSGSDLINCSSSRSVTQQVSLQVAFQRSASVQVSQSVTNTLSSQIGLKATVAPGLDVSGSVTIGESFTRGTVNSTGWQETVTRSDQTTVILDVSDHLKT